jgi:hypothetical protein
MDKYVVPVNRIFNSGLPRKTENALTTKNRKTLLFEPEEEAS